jgi:hypothetical protein
MPTKKKVQPNLSEEPIREYVIGEFRGDFPDVPISPQVDLESLTNGDEKPFFVTLPVARIGEVSANGLLYDEELVTEIEGQMIGKGGIMGHIKPEERDSKFPIEDVDWVGTTREAGTTWGKAYVPPGQTREFIRRLMARGGQLATSIYGPYAKREPLSDGRFRLRGLKLESLDLAPADRAALNLGGKFAVTAQMTEGFSEDIEMEKEQLIAELTVKDVPQALRDQIIQEFSQANDQQKSIAELQSQIEAKDTVIAELQKEAAKRAEEKFEAALDGLVAETVNWQVEGEEPKKKVDALKTSYRARVISEMGDKRDMEALKTAAERVWEGEYQIIAETMRDALAGPSARVSGKPRGSRELDTSPDAVRKAQAETGI